MVRPLTRIQNYFKANLSLLGIMPHCIFGDQMDKTNIQQFDGKHWEQEIVVKSFVKDLYCSN